MSHEPANIRERLEADIQSVEQEIRDFNDHWLGHKHLFPASAAVIMGLIFLGMLLPDIELYLWAGCGVVVLLMVGIRFWRSKEADRLNASMQTAHKAFKAYERSRRK